MPLKLFAVNRERLCKQLKEDQCPEGAVVVLQGGAQQQRYCTDTDDVFRQVCVSVMTVFGIVDMYVRVYGLSNISMYHHYCKIYVLMISLTF